MNQATVDKLKQTKLTVLQATEMPLRLRLRLAKRIETEIQREFEDTGRIEPDLEFENWD